MTLSYGFCPMIGLAMLSAGLASDQEVAKEKPGETLVARMEVIEHEHCFTVRFFLKNTGESPIEVVEGHGQSGQQIVPRFEAGDVGISPPTYLRPPRRSMRPDSRRIPAGEEILYGVYTMGYPILEKAREDPMSASIYFRELKQTIRAAPRPLRIPAAAIPRP